MKKQKPAAFHSFTDAAKAFQKREAAMTVTPEGNGGYDMEAKPRTPAQAMATKKAGQVSAQKRKGGLA